MKNIPLFELFRSLSDKERRALKKFLASPFHNQREDVQRLFDYLQKYSIAQQQKKWEKEQIFKYLFPDKKYDRQQLYYVFSFLKKLIEGFLIINYIQTQKVENDLRLAQIYRKRGLQQPFQETIKKAEKVIGQQIEKDANYHFQSYQLYYEKAEFDGLRSRTEVSNLQRSADELSIYFISQKLKQACQVLSYQSFSKVKQEEVFLQEILKYVEQKAYNESIPSIEVYYSYYKAFTQKSGDINFPQLKALVKKYHQLFSNSEMRNIYLMPINFGIKRFNSGEREYLKEVFELYQQGLELGVFLENNQLSRFTYSNIVLAGLGLKDFKWVETFIHTYRPYLEERHRDNTFNYNLANLYFQLPDYPKVMDLLQKVEFDDVLYNLESRRMLLKVYYSLGETEALYSLLDSFKRFIYRQKELGYHRKSFINLIRFTNRLLNIEFRDKNSREKLKLAIESTKEVAEKTWLLAQLD